MTKRYFTFEDGGGATYAVVALDEAFAIKALGGVEFGYPSEPFAKATDEDGNALKMREIGPDMAARIRVDTTEDDRGRGRIPLTECDLGEWFSSEY